ncbi:MAG: hypothetical protein ACM37U_08520, partial [Gemmatimonas sp.]
MLIQRPLRAAVFIVLPALANAPAQPQSPAPVRPDSAFVALAKEVVTALVAFTPSGAVSTGLHEWKNPATGAVVVLDTLLDDFSAPEIARQRRYLTSVQQRLAAIPRARLDPQSQADYDLIANNVASLLFNLTEERFTESRPQFYPEVLGNALFAPVMLEYADGPTRAAHLAARVRQVPRFF